MGFELGAASMAAIITLGPVILLLTAMLAVTWPEVEVVPMLVVLGIVAATLPIALYPTSYLLWQALDIVMRPPTPDDFEIVVEVDAP